MRRNILKYGMRALSVLIALLFVFEASAQLVYAGAEWYRGRRPVFAQPQAVRHEPVQIYSKEPLLRQPVVVYTAEDALAEEYGEPVSVEEYTTVYQTGEETYKTVVDTVPNTYIDEQGEQALIDNTLQIETRADGEVFTNTANSLDVELPVEMGEGDGVRVAIGNDAVRLVPLEGDYTRASAAGDSVLYNDVFDGIDVQYTSHEVSLKEFIILRRPSDKTTFEYRLEAPGMEVRAEESVVNIYKPGESLPTFTISAPLMCDAAGAYSFDVGVTLDGDVVRLWGNAEWLGAPERVYPVQIDPSVGDTARASASMLSPAPTFYQETAGYAIAGWIQKDSVGYPGDYDYGSARSLLYFDTALDGIAQDSVIEEARLVLDQYAFSEAGGNLFEVLQLDGPASYAALAAHTGYSNHWDYLLDVPCHYVGQFASSIAVHSFDVTDTVSNWLAGAEPNYGFMVKAAVDSGQPPAAMFYSPGLVSSDRKPRLEIDWRVPGDVPDDYGIDATTVNLRPIAQSGTGGQLDFYGVFFDGVAQPLGEVVYTLDSGAAYSGSADVDRMYLYANTEGFELASGYPPLGTKYRRKVSNWQTETVFTNWKYDTLYTLSAHAAKGGTNGASVKSEPFLVYKVKQFDTLSSIANWYGVPYETLAYDNRIVDMLLVEGNSVFVRNPKRNAGTPYNPDALSEGAQREIDQLLMGRGLHCEFGYEPINLNTGNFIFESADVSAADFGGEFGISRFYNSMGAERNSVFGRGWSFNWDERLSQDSDGGIYYQRGDGSVVHFAADGAGGYEAPAGYDLKLERTLAEERRVDFGVEEDPDVQALPVYGYTISGADGVVRQFSALGLLVQSTDINGFVTKLEYDAQRRLERIVAPSGLAYTLSTDAEGRIRSIALPGGSVLRYAYDALGRLEEYTDGSGGKTSYAYDAQHRMTSWSDANNTQIIENEYDARGRVVKQTDARGGVVTLSYAEGRTSVTDMRGNSTVYHYDAQHRTTKVEYPDGTAEEKGYDGSNRLAFELDRQGTRTEFEWDGAGNLVGVLRSDGARQEYEYDAENRQTSFTDWDGARTQNIYNAQGDLVRVIYPDGSENKYTWDTQHRMQSSTDALGNETKYEWNGALLSAVEDALGGRTQFYYDALGRQTSVVDACGGVTRTVYDAAGRKIGEEDADGGYTEYVYDAAGRCIAIIDARGYRTDFEYDDMDNLVRIIDALGNEYTFSYDAAGNQLSEKGPLGATIRREYDELGRMISETDADGGKRSYDYDALGRLVRETSALLGETRYEYDAISGGVSRVRDAGGGETRYEYDVAGRQVRTVSPASGEEQYVYDEMGRVSKQTDAAGLETSYVYDAAGRLVGTSDTLGRTAEYKYDAAGRLVCSIDAMGKATEYEYDAAGRVVLVRDALGIETKTTYSAGGRVLEVSGALGSKSKTEYDANGNVVRSTDALGGKTEYEYDALDRVVLVRDALGGEVQTEYDAAGNVAVMRDEFGSETVYTYSAGGRALTCTDALGNVTRNEYDAAGNEVRTTAANGAVSSREYDKAGRLVRSVTPGGLETEYKYDAAGRLVRQRDSLGGGSGSVYDAAGRIVQSIDALGNVTKYEYDAAGRQICVRGYDGNETRTEYDALGRVVRSIDAEGNVTNNSYDALGRLLRRRDAFGRIWLYEYDELGRQTKATDPLGGVTRSEYDMLGRLTKQSDALGGEVSYVYDALGRITEQSDALGRVTRTVYDAAGRVTKETAADGGVREYLYDALGQVLKEMDALGNVTQHSYDSVGAVLGSVTPKGDKYSYEYDIKARTSSVRDPLGGETRVVADEKGRTVRQILADGGETRTEYDALGRVVRVEQPEGATQENSYDERGDLVETSDGLGRSTLYRYDTQHRLVAQINAEGGETKYEYDERGNLSRMTAPGGGATEYEYDPLDRLVCERDALGGETRYEYDALGRQVSVREAGGAATRIEYDAVGNIVRVTDALGQAQEFEYDAMNRLVRERDAGGSEAKYEYDKNGQLVRQSDALGKKSSYSYDANGNLAGSADGAGRGAEYIYDALDRLVRVDSGGEAIAEYEYDAVGRLIRQKESGGAASSYSWDTAGQLLETSDAMGRTASYEYDAGGRLIRSVAGDGSSTEYAYNGLDALTGKSHSSGETGAGYRYDADGALVGMRDGSGVSSYGYDELGRIIESVGPQGDRVRYEYNAAGDISAIEYPDGSRVEYSYDALHRMTEVSGRDGEKTQYSWDAQDRLELAQYGDGSLSRAEYDALGRTTELVNIAADGSVASKYEYEYDAAGNITKETATQAGERITREYAYTQRGQLAGVRENGGAAGGAGWRYEYDEAGRRVRLEETSAAGVRVVAYEYDKSGQLVRSRDSENGETTYEYDGRGNLKRQSGSGAGLEYEYTAENRLSAVREGGVVLMAAVYDGLGNRAWQVSRQEAGADGHIEQEEVWRRIAAQEAADAPEQTPQAQDVPKAEKPQTSEESASQLEDIPQADIPEAEEEGGGISLFWYGFWQGAYRMFAGANQALGAERGEWLRRIWPEEAGRSEAAGGAEQQQEEAPAAEESWDEAAPEREELLEETGLEPEEIEKILENKPVRWAKDVREVEVSAYQWLEYSETWYTYDLTRENAEVLAQSKAWGVSDIYTYGVQRLTHEMPGGEQGYLHDGRGSVAQTTEQGLVVDSLRYGPYGEVLSGGEELLSYYGFNAEEHNPETGLQYLRARYYAPELGAFTTRDTYGGSLHEPLTQNRYLYALGDPVNFVDPGGMAGIALDAGGAVIRRVPQPKPAAPKTTLPTAPSGTAGISLDGGGDVVRALPKYTPPPSNKDKPSTPKVPNNMAGITQDAGEPVVRPVLPNKIEQQVDELENINRRFCEDGVQRATSEDTTPQYNPFQEIYCRVCGTLYKPNPSHRYITTTNVRCTKCRNYISKGELLETFTVGGSFQEGIFSGSGSISLGYSEIMLRGQADKKFYPTEKEPANLIGIFGKVSIVNSSGKIGVTFNNLAISLKGVGDVGTTTGQAGIGYGNGLGVAAKAKAAVASGRVTIELEIYGWQVEFGVSGDYLALGAEIDFGISESGFSHSANASLGAGLGYIIRVKPPEGIMWGNFVVEEGELAA